MNLQELNKELAKLNYYNVLPGAQVKVVDRTLTEPEKFNVVRITCTSAFEVIIEVE